MPLRGKRVKGAVFHAPRNRCSTLTGRSTLAIHQGGPIGGAGGMTVPQRQVGDPALANLACVPQHPRLAVRQEGGVLVIDEPKAGGRGGVVEFRGQENMTRRWLLQLNKIELADDLERCGQVLR